MNTYPYLHCRKGIYYFRRATPKDLLYFIGQREITKTLGTTDIRVARKAALEMSEQLDELFIKIRNGKKLLSADEVACVALHVNRAKTERLMLAALEEFKDRTKEHDPQIGFNVLMLWFFLESKLKDNYLNDDYRQYRCTGYTARWNEHKYWLHMLENPVHAVP